MTRHIQQAALLTLAALLTMALAACVQRQSTPTTDTGQIAMQVHWAPSPVQTAAFHPDGLARPQTVPSNVVTMRAVVSGAGMSAVTQDFDVATHPSGGTVNNVPAGSNRSVDLQGLDSGGGEIYDGKVNGITVVAGQVANAGTITLSPVTGGGSTALAAAISSPSTAQSITTGGSVTFAGSASGGTAPYSYAWDFDSTGVGGGPAASTSQNPGAVTFSNVGTYVVKLTITDAASATASATVTITVSGSGSVSPPVAPTGVAATPGNNQVALSWTAVSGANGYNVYRSQTSGLTTTTGSKLNGSLQTSASFTDSTAVNGTTYYYIVTAVNAGGEGPASGEVSAAPQTPPAAPTALAATAGVTQVGLSWTAASGADGYNVYRGQTSGVTPATGTKVNAGSPVTTTTYTDGTVTNGTTYYYVVTGLHLGVEGPASNEASARPDSSVPGAPTQLATTAGNGQVTLNWDPPSSGGSVISYNLYWSTAAGVTVSSNKVTGVSSPYVHTPVVNDTVMHYRVSAVNGLGEGPLSAEVFTVPSAHTADGEQCKTCHQSGGTDDISDTGTGWHATAAETGYKPAINSVSISSAGAITVGVSVTDETGAAVSGVAPTDFEFTLAYLDMGPGQYPGTDSALYDDTWVPCFTTTRTDLSGTGTVTQATVQVAATGSSFVDNSDGTYTWVLQANADGSGGDFNIVASAGYDTTTPTHSMVYRVGIEMRPLHGSPDPLGIANSTFDFVPNVPGTGNLAQTAATQYRELSVTAACNVCHNADGNSQGLYIHGGPRRNLKYCDTCHNPSSTDLAGKSLDLESLIHKLHMGKDLPSVQAGNTFSIIGYSGTPVDYSKEVYPDNITDCEKCHETNSGATDYAQQASYYASVPSIAACGSCHDNIYFTASPPESASYWTPHSGGIATDSQCASCHNSSATDLKNVAYAHRWKAIAQEADNYTFKIDSATYTSGTGQVSVVFEVDKLTTPMDLATDIEWTNIAQSRLAIEIGWKAAAAADYTNPGSGASKPGGPLTIPVVTSGALDGGVTNNLDGTYTVTATLPATGQAADVGIAVLEGHPAANVLATMGSLVTTVYDTLPVVSASQQFTINATSLTGLNQRRTAAYPPSCVKCHTTLTVHGENRTLTNYDGTKSVNMTVCTTCHNTSATDIALRPAAGTSVDSKAESSVDFKRMIHAIHAGTYYLTGAPGLTIYGYGGSVYTYASASGMPVGTALEHCSVCHGMSSEYMPPLATGIFGTTIDSGTSLTDVSDDKLMSPYTATCEACHANDAALTHMADYGGRYDAVQSAISYQ